MGLFSKWPQPTPEAAEKLADMLYQYRVFFLKETDQRVNWEKAPERIKIPKLVRYYLQKRIDRENGRGGLASLLEGETSKS